VTAAAPFEFFKSISLSGRKKCQPASLAHRRVGTIKKYGEM
jgi:hypothetical protein